MKLRLFLSEDELAVAMEWLDGFRDGSVNDKKFRLACLVAIESGLRRSEIVRLRKVDLSGRMMTVRRTKGSNKNHYKTTKQSLSEGTAADLQAFFDASEGQYPFARNSEEICAAVDGSHEFQKLINREGHHLKTLLQTRAKTFPLAGGLYGYHLWRHTLSALAKKKGLSQPETMALLAHESKAMYNHYGGTEDQTLQATVDRLFGNCTNTQFGGNRGVADPVQ